MSTLAAVALAVAGCGGGGGSGGASTPPPTPPPPPGPASFAPGPARIAATGITLPLGKCVNLSNMLEAPDEGEWGRAFVDADAGRIKAAGFSTVRLPVRFSAHAAAGPPYTIDPTFMARVRHVLDTNVAAGLNVILDMHHYEELFVDPDGHRARFAALWRQVAAEFADAPASVWFELINEPNTRLDDANLLEVLNPALAAVRETNPTRPVVIGGENWSGIDSLATLTLPEDPYVVPTFHYYDPFDFTHQGAPWADPTPPTGRAFGTAADKAQLEQALAKVANYVTRTGRVPFIGEYGAFDQILLPQRAAYYGTITRAFASIGIQSCAWGYTNTFHLWRDESGWIDEILREIATTTTMPPDL